MVLPELALCSYMASREIWQYADENGADTAAWAVETARKYDTYIGVGYLDRENGDYYNRYMIAGPEGVCGVVSKSEGETAVFRQGDFGSVIETPFGTVGVAICYDSRRRHFYDNVKDRALSLILFPHGAPADPKKPEAERADNDRRCMLYAEAFGVPVVYANSVGPLEYMPGVMGAMMKRHGFRMNGMSRIYGTKEETIETDVPEAIGEEVPIHSKRRVKDLPFYNGYLTPGHTLFRSITVKQDILWAIKYYGKNHLAAAERLTKE